MDAGRVDGHRLLGEDVLAGLDGRAQVDRPEMRRGAEQDHVDPAAQELAVGVEPDEAATGATSSLAAMASFLRRVSRLFSRRSAKASAMATSRTFESAASACEAAPVPRSPQPISPTRRMSLPAACTFGRAARVPAAAVALMKWRREADSALMVGPSPALGLVGSGPDDVRVHRLSSYSPSGISTHSFRVNDEASRESAGRKGNSRAREAGSSGAPYSDTSNASIRRTRPPRSAP